MKTKILDYCIRIIKTNNNSLSSEKIAEIRYGLEGIYLTITKAIFIFLTAYLLGIFKEMFIMLFIYNILRTTGFGLHAEKSWQCWISSTIVFLVIPFISKYIFINNIVKDYLCIGAIIVMFKYAPADTKKHPLVNKRKNMMCKYLSVINCIILSFISLLFKDNTISNLIIFGIYIELMLIIPFTYKLFNLPYSNYKKYGLNSNV